MQFAKKTACSVEYEVSRRLKVTGNVVLSVRQLVKEGTQKWSGSRIVLESACFEDQEADEEKHEIGF